MFLWLIHSFIHSIKFLLSINLVIVTDPRKIVLKQEKRVFFNIYCVNWTHDIHYLFILSLWNLNATPIRNCYLAMKMDLILITEKIRIDRVSSWGRVITIRLVCCHLNYPMALPEPVVSVWPTGHCWECQALKPLYVHFILFLIPFTFTHSSRLKVMHLWSPHLCSYK